MERSDHYDQHELAIEPAVRRVEESDSRQSVCPSPKPLDRRPTVGYVDFLGTLPIELLRSITASLTSKDLKTLRIMNRRLNAVSLESLFKAITLSIVPESIHQLLHITSSTFYAAHVRHVDWNLFYDYRKVNMYLRVQDLDLYRDSITALQPALSLQPFKAKHKRGRKERNIYPLFDLQY